MSNMNDSFGVKWEQIPNYGFDDKTAKFRLEWYLQRYGWGSEEALARFIRTREWILDAGTGLGSHVKMYAEMTKGQVFGVDISPSIKLGERHIKHLPNAHLIQADLMNLPFQKECFDFIISDQVLHHTPNTEKAFKGLVPYLEKDGQIAIYVYKKKGDMREYCDDELRKVTTEMSPEDCKKFSEAVTLLGKVLSDYDVNMQRFVYWQMFKCFWNEGLDWDTNVMTNFDWYYPRYAWRHTPDEVRGWFDDMGLKILYFDVGDSGISVRAKK